MRGAGWPGRVSSELSAKHPCPSVPVLWPRPRRSGSPASPLFLPSNTFRLPAGARQGTLRTQGHSLSHRPHASPSPPAPGCLTVVSVKPWRPRRAGDHPSLWGTPSYICWEEWVEDTTLEKPGGTLGRPVPEQVLWPAGGCYHPNSQGPSHPDRDRGGGMWGLMTGTEGEDWKTWGMHLKGRVESGPQLCLPHVMPPRARLGLSGSQCPPC